jgi:hypothetical protein
MSIQSMLNEQALDNVRTAVNNYRRLSAAHSEWVSYMNHKAVKRFTESEIPFDVMDDVQKEKFKAKFNNWVHREIEKLGGEVEGYCVTNGLMVHREGMGKPQLLKISFAKLENNVVVATVESARNLSTLRSFGIHYMTRDALRDMPEDPYNNMVFNKAAFALFGLSI